MYIYISGADPEILKRGLLYVGYHGWLAKKILGLDDLKDRINVRNYKFLAKYYFLSV